ncbi:hypothetical protein JXJ21_20395 [candidate division KSB1 bacterium]|nr:hypothetical protein [candidate division KSB1 bacterium]
MIRQCCKAFSSVMILACLMLSFTSAAAQNEYAISRLDCPVYQIKTHAQINDTDRSANQFFVQSLMINSFTERKFQEGEAESNKTITKKSKGKAFMFSMLLPGAGEYYVGRKTRAKSFFISEISLWTIFAGLRIYGGWNEREYKTFAEDHALANTDGKKHRYFVDIGNFDNIYLYNDFQLRERDLEDVYPETAQYFWQWDNTANRDKFERMRIRSDDAYYRALFVGGIIFVNHLVSAIDAVWVSYKHNKQLNKAGTHLDIHFGQEINHPEIRLSLVRNF